MTVAVHDRLPRQHCCHKGWLRLQEPGKRKHANDRENWENKRLVFHRFTSYYP